MAEEKCAFLSDAPWTPKLHLAYLLRQLWRIKQSTLRTGRDATSQIERFKIAINETLIHIPSDDRVDIPPQLMLWNTTKPARMVKLARKHLANRRKEAWDLRIHYLASREELAALKEDKRTEKAIRLIRQREEREHTFRLLKQYTQADKQTIVKEVDVPSKPSEDPRAKSTKNWTKITEQQEMENAFYNWNKKQFAQARNTAFMQEPLRSLCGFNGLTPFTEKVLNGTADLS